MEEMAMILSDSVVGETQNRFEHEHANEEEQDSENCQEEERNQQGGGDINDDEEDLMDRYEDEVEAAVCNFIDELPIDRDTYHDSSNEYEDDFVYKARTMRRIGEGKLALGTAFFTSNEFKLAVLDYALTNGKNIEQDRWDKTKISFKCGMGGKCQWRIYCSYDSSKHKWVIKTRNGYHKCTPNGKCKMLKSPVIARLFLDKLREKGDLMPEEIQNNIKETWRLVSSRNQCQRGRTLALKWLEKEYAEQYAHLRGYAEEIVRSNPGSTVLVDTMPNSAGEDVFNRFYVCFANIRSSWRGYCRPVIGVDGTFLKIAVKGILLVAIGHDANNQIYPLAWAVVQSENADNWLWFIKQIKVDLVLGNGTKFVIISDRCNALLSAVKSELPMAEHRLCVKHIYENLKKKHKNKDLLKPMVWGLAWSNNSTTYGERLKNMRAYNNYLADDVLKEHPKNWCRAFFRIGSCVEDVDNNATESFNASITKARAKAKPMVPMLETIRRQAMQRIAKSQSKANSHDKRLTEYVYKILESERGDAEKCRTFTATTSLYEVSLHGNNNTVNINRGTCTCGKWQITGIPCEHAYGAMLDSRNLNVEDYVSEFFSMFTWQDTYNTPLLPVRGPRYWMQSNAPLVTPPPEPNIPGRKKQKKQKKFPRFKGTHESPTKKNKNGKETLARIGRVMHCSKCGEASHNAAGCKLFPKKTKTRQEANTSQDPETICITQPSQGCLEIQTPE